MKHIERIVVVGAVILLIGTLVVGNTLQGGAVAPDAHPAIAPHATATVGIQAEVAGAGGPRLGREAGRPRVEQVHDQSETAPGTEIWQCDPLSTAYDTSGAHLFERVLAVNPHAPTHADLLSTAYDTSGAHLFERVLEVNACR